MRKFTALFVALGAFVLAAASPTASTPWRDRCTCPPVSRLQ